MRDFINQKITAANIAVFIKAALFGFLSVESWYFSKAISVRIINEYAINGHRENEALIISVIGLLLIIVYLFVRGFHLCVKKMFKSCRLDVLIVLFFGVLIGKSFSDISTDIYAKIISALTNWQLLILVTAPFVIGFSLLLRVIQLWITEKNKKETPFFISDIEREFKKDDLLGFSEEAERFAERVFNQGSSDSMVFGIDAPWGIGKSTFVNYCIKTWEEKKYVDKVAVYKFSPLRFEDRDNLFEKFIDGLVVTIKRNSFIPEVHPLISKYSRLIKPKSSFSFFGFEIELPLGTYTADDAFDDLEIVLKDSDKKIIVVIDDLDRLTFSAIKNVLYAIKKSFALSNVSYVLCYDTENIGVFDGKNSDMEKVREFLEKFVNVKITLFVDSEKLESFIFDNSKVVLGVDEWLYQKNTQLALKGLREILQSPEYYNYVPFIGDLRKIKRYINIIKLFELEKIDHGNSDLNAQDLTHLLLIYINYPNIFRKIYNTETSNRRGFFSVVIKYDDYYPEDEVSQSARVSMKDNQFKNSTLYREYLKNGGLTEEQKFLLEKVFTVSKRLETTEIDNVSADIKHTYACFNGGSPWSGGRNLEDYLYIIVRGKKPKKPSQYRFYLNAKEKIKNGDSIEDIFSMEEFSVLEGEKSHEQLWRVIMDSANEFSPKVGSDILAYLLNRSADYSFFTNEKIGVGLRDDIDYFLVKLLDTVGWSDSEGGHTENTEENIKEIAEWVFGEGRHVNMGVLETLLKEDRGIIGLYDLMAFRLFCSADRGGDIFNLTRAIAKHGNPKAPTEGPTRNIAIEEMREISQKIFQLFKNQYIDKSKNIFEIINSLSLADFTGKYQTFIEEKIVSGEVENIDAIIGALKSRMKSFITYQLGNSFISSGIGCGYYDPVGKEDKNGIKAEINKYLFDECFNPEKNPKNYEHFIDYLLINFASVLEYSRKYIPHINEFTKVLEKKRLADYWKKNVATIKALNLIEKDKIVFAGNYTASYKINLTEVYEVLDAFLQETEEKEKNETKKTELELKLVREDFLCTIKKVAAKKNITKPESR